MTASQSNLTQEASNNDAADQSRAQRLLLPGACASLLLIFAVISYSAALTKNATYDEPLHTLGGLLHRATGEFRLDAEDPPFFGFWASLPHGSNALKLDFNSAEWQRYTSGMQDYQWAFTMLTLYRTAGNDGDALIQRSRLMFIAVGVMLGGLIAWWSWKLAGAWAAIIATAFYALDPNFLAHSALVKNDVMLSFLFVIVAASIWRFGQRGTWLSALGIALGTALAINVKFSAMLLGPLIFLLLLIRALLPSAWNVIGIHLTQRWQRLLVVPAVCIVTGIICYTTIWICYGMRFAPAGDRQTLLNLSAVTELVKQNKVRQKFGPGLPFTAEDVSRETPGFVVDTLVDIEASHLLPQAWIYGFIYTYATTISRTSYLMGKESNTGFLFYFPLAMLFKTPMATLIAIPTSLIGIAAYLSARRRRLAEEYHESPPQHPLPWWAIAAFAVPPLIYFLSAMTSNMNIGLRHILPVYPFIFIAIGVGLSWMIARWKVVGCGLGGVLLLGLAMESLGAYPDYIPFFNKPSGGSQYGIHLLSDSNLDWGQDLKQLGRWQRNHQDRPLYLSYFGVPDPTFYGIVATHTPGGWNFEQSKRFPSPDQRCYLAVSATNLQGIYYMPELKQSYKQLDSVIPSYILGGSIYIYELPAPDSMFRNSVR